MTAPLQRLSASVAGPDDTLARAVHAANAGDPGAVELARLGEIVVARVATGAAIGAWWQTARMLRWPGIVGGLVIAGVGAYELASRGAPPSRVEMPLAVTLQVAPPLLAPPASPAPPATTSTPSGLPVVAVPAAAAKARLVTARVSPPLPSGTELDLLRSAESALRSDPSAALARTDDHLRAYPLGLLAQERELLAIDALVRLQRRAVAEERVQRFEARYPNSPLLRRLARLLAVNDRVGNIAPTRTSTEQGEAEP